MRPGRSPSVWRRPRRCPRTGAGGPRQIPRNGRPAASQARIGSARPCRSRRAIAGAAAPTPGTTSASAPRERLGVAGDDDVGADRVERLVDADEVAGAVVDDGDARRRALSVTPSVPFVDATPVRRGSGSQAARSARPSALNAASARWWSLRPVPRQMERRAGGPGERLEGVLDELERQAAGALAAERQVDDRVRTTADIDRRRVASDFVHRDRCSAEAGDAGAIAERLRERRTEHERDVLDRVVLVDLEVAVGVDREVEQAVVGERAEEMVVEADPGRDRGVAGAVEAERDRDVGLARACGRP